MLSLFIFGSFFYGGLAQLVEHLPCKQAALTWAAYNNAADAAKLLIQAGADMNARENMYGMTALMLAEERDAKEVLALLKAAGAQ